LKRTAYDRKLPYALNSNNELVSIYSIKEHGLACNCRCPKCRKPLEARIGTGARARYFAHSKHSNCHGATMTILHMLSEKIIEENMSVMAPQYKSVAPRKLEFVEVEVERREDRKDMQPDIVGITADGKRWAIEINNTHEVNGRKRQKIVESGITCLEINVSKQAVDNLKEFLLCSPMCRDWINNPNDEESLPQPSPQEIPAQGENRQMRYDYYSGLKDEMYKAFLTDEYSDCQTPLSYGKSIFSKETMAALRVEIDESVMRIPDNCSSLDEYYVFIKDKKYFMFDRQRHFIIDVVYNSTCGQLIIFHKNSIGVSYHYATCVYIDNDGSVKEQTIECSSYDIPNIRKAKEIEWDQMMKQL